MNYKHKLNEEQSSPKKLKSEYQRVISDGNLETIFLDDKETSWIKIARLDDQTGLTIVQFEELWKLKPENRLLIKISDKIIECPRYSKSYLKSYKFSGIDHESDQNLPELVAKIFEYSKTINPKLNQCLANWYEYNGCIGKHSDDTRQLLDDSDIFSFSFGPATRYFFLEPKKNSSGKHLRIELKHNVMIIMGGKCQTTHYHSVERVKNGSIKDGRRLNLTFRCFK